MRFPESVGEYAEGKWMRRLVAKRIGNFILENCVIHGPEGDDDAPIDLSNWQSDPSIETTVVVRNCVLGGSLSLTDNKQAFVKRNLFVGTGNDHHLMVHGQSVSQLVIRQNVFAGKSNNDIVLANPRPIQVLELSNNTFSSRVG